MNCCLNCGNILDSDDWIHYLLQELEIIGLDSKSNHDMWLSVLLLKEHCLTYTGRYDFSFCSKTCAISYCSYYQDELKALVTLYLAKQK